MGACIRPVRDVDSFPGLTNLGAFLAVTSASNQHAGSRVALVHSCSKQYQAAWHPRSVLGLQAPHHHMETVAEVLGIPSHKVVCHVKRIGGGFGGKESRSVFTNAAIAVAAYQTRRPVRLALDRAEDMQMTGHRHAFLIKYKVNPFAALLPIRQHALAPCAMGNCVLTQEPAGCWGGRRRGGTLGG